MRKRGCELAPCQRLTGAESGVEINMNIVFYFNTKGSCVEHTCKAPVFAVKAFERGYYPIQTPATAEQLNGNIPKNVLEAAEIGSHFGWDCPGAKDAVLYVQQKEKEAAIAL